MISPTEENYLKTLFYLENKEGEATANELSKALGIRMSTVSSMMKKLYEKEFVIYESYKPIRMTEKGRKQAGLILRKHRLAEMFLVDIMGLGWEEVHSIAEQMEHIKSPKFFDRMDELLGSPKADPHGSPIPDREGNVQQPDYNQLSECVIGASAQLSAISESTTDFLQYLRKRGLDIGTLIKVLAIEDYDGSMTVEFNQKQEILSKVVCDRLLVK